jgi:HlyD family secretion protein
VLAFVLVLASHREPQVSEPVAKPHQSPFVGTVSGSGIVEASSENIDVASDVSGVVREVYVQVGDLVKFDQALFRLDDLETKAKLRMREADVAVAQAKVAEARSLEADAEDRLRLVQGLTDRRALSQEEVDRRTRAVEIAQTQVKIAEANLLKAQRDVEQVEVDLERLTVRAPIGCRVLQVNVQPGEFAQGDPDVPLMVVGCDDPLHVRVDIDENDAWRFDPKGKAVGSLRGNPDIKVLLTFVRIEPFVIPKKSLTGNGATRVDTRVLQVIYEFAPDNLPIYIGQQMDVSIEEKPG